MRSVIEVIEMFKLLYDQYGREEGLIEQEICRHLNTALTAVMSDCFYPKNKVRNVQEDPPYGFEKNQYSTADFAPLKLPLEFIPVSGKISYADIRASFPDTVVRREQGEIETRKCEIFHYNYVERWDTTNTKYQECMWVRDNDWTRVQRNPFRTPTEKYPCYLLGPTDVLIHPAGENQVRLQVTREHVYVWYDPADPTTQVDFEIQGRVLYAVLLKALSLAGVSVRDGELYRMIENEMNQ